MLYMSLYDKFELTHVIQKRHAKVIKSNDYLGIIYVNEEAICLKS